ncbi:MAG: family intrarane metalloprotease protein, partial [Caulobacter sp.]|nr:family intrarane metalloprotease protein [Caulobacter sp.]
MGRARAESKSVTLATMIDAMRGSAFLRDVGPADRRIGPILLTLPVGAMAGVLAAIVGGAASVSLYGALVVGLQGPAAAGGLLDVLTNPALLATSLTAVLLVLTLLAGTNGPLAVAFTAMAALLHGRRLMSYVTSAPRFRWRLLLAGLILFTVGVGPLLALDAWFDPKTAGMPILTLTPTTAGRLTYAGAAIVLLLIAAAAEELVFRGWLLKVTGAFTRRPWALLIVNGLAFAAIHFDPNVDAFLVRTVMGVGLAYMALRLGGIELAVGAHAA